MAKTYTVEGFKNVSYFSKKRNEQVEGTSLYVSRDISAEDGATGRECKEVWLTQQATYSPLSVTKSVSGTMNVAMRTM